MLTLKDQALKTEERPELRLPLHAHGGALTGESIFIHLIWMPQAQIGQEEDLEDVGTCSMRMDGWEPV